MATPPQDYFYLSDLTSHPTQQQLLCGVATAFVSCSEPIHSADSTVHCICLNPTSPLLPRKSLSLAKRLGVILAPPPHFRPTELNITSLKMTSQMSSNWSVSLVAHASNLICQLQSPPASLDHSHLYCVLCVYVPCPCVRCAMSWCGVPTLSGRLLQVYCMTPGVHVYSPGHSTTGFRDLGI